MDLKAEYKLCLNDEVVPAPVENITYLDPLGLAEDIQLNLDRMDRVELVSFKASHNMRWLEKVLKVPAQYMKTNLHKFRLMQEIKDEVEDIKKDIKVNARAPTQWKSLLLLHIRNRILFVQNRTDCVIVGLVGVTGSTSCRDEEETLLWLARQFQQDLQLVQDPAADQPAGGWKRSSESWGDYEDEITEVIENLKKHPQCLKASWVPSRKSFRVQKHSKAFKFFRVSNLGSRKKTSVNLEDIFGQVESSCLEFLDTSPSSASSAPAIQDQEQEAPATED